MTSTKPCILLVDQHKTTQDMLKHLLPEATVMIAPNATRAIEKANKQLPNVVIIELSLANHSGFEFLYEFRTYFDWQHVPVIVYSSVKLEPSVLGSRAWEQMGVVAYLYKLETSLELLRSVIERNIGLRTQSV